MNPDGEKVREGIGCVRMTNDGMDTRADALAALDRLLARLEKYEAVVRAAKEVGKMWPGRPIRSNYSVAVIELLQALAALQKEEG